MEHPMEPTELTPDTRLSRRQVLGGVAALAAALPSRAGAAPPHAPAEPPAAGRPVRGYVDGPWGQVHYRMCAPAPRDRRAPPLVFFHQNPTSSMEYEVLLARMASDRLCVALDTPGYGLSDPPPAPTTIEAYTAALLEALDRIPGLAPATAVDAFGFHTGTFLAVEAALQRPARFRRLALAGVPYVVGEERQQFYDSRVTHHRPRSKSGADWLDTWYYAVVERPPTMTAARAEALGLERLRAGERSWWAYQAVFTYPSETKLPQVTQPTLLMAVNDILAEYTKRAHPLMKNARLLEMPDAEGLVMLEEDAAVFETELRGFLG